VCNISNTKCHHTELYLASNEKFVKDRFTGKFSIPTIRKWFANDQFAFQPTGRTRAALANQFNSVTGILETDDQMIMSDVSLQILVSPLILFPIQGRQTTSTIDSLCSLLDTL
jgi:hypothetical protein